MQFDTIARKISYFAGQHSLECLVSKLEFSQLRTLSGVALGTESIVELTKIEFLVYCNCSLICSDFYFFSLGEKKLFISAKSNFKY